MRVAVLSLENNGCWGKKLKLHVCILKQPYRDCEDLVEIGHDGKRENESVAECANRWGAWLNCDSHRETLVVAHVGWYPKRLHRDAENDQRYLAPVAQWVVKCLDAGRVADLAYDIVADAILFAESGRYRPPSPDDFDE